MVLGMRPYKLKLDEESRFGNAKWFWPNIFAQFAPAGEKAQRNLISTREHCNKYDLTAAPCF